MTELDLAGGEELSSAFEPCLRQIKCACLPGAAHHAACMSATALHLNEYNSISSALGQERLPWSMPFITEQSKVVFVPETIAEIKALAQRSFVGKAQFA